MRLCSHCKERPVRSEKQYSCAECHRQYMRGRYKNNPEQKDMIRERGKKRKKEIRDLIIQTKSVPCFDCHQTYPWYCMDFDHLRDKKFNLSNAATKQMAIATVQAEIDKCDVVCANCHRIRTFRLRKDS